MEHVQPQAFTGDGRDAADRFVEQMGVMWQAENQPRIAGRIFGLFLVEGRPIGLRELAERLKVSRASASTNARLLAQVGFLERVSMRGDRQDYYQLVADPYPGLLRTLAERMAAAATFLDRAERSFPSERQAAKERLRGLAGFYRAAVENVTALSRTYTRP